MSRSPIPRHRALLAGFCLAGALSAQRQVACHHAEQFLG